MITFNKYLCMFIALLLMIKLEEITTKGYQKGSSSNGVHSVCRMKISQIAIVDQWVDIDCCVDGYSDIKWAFKGYKNGSWTDKLPKGSEFEKEKRHVIIKRFSPENVGYYKCNASDTTGRWLSNTTLVVQGCTPKNSEMKITAIPEPHAFYEYESGKICCKMVTLESFIKIITSWIFKQNDSITWFVYLFGPENYFNSTLPSGRGYAWNLITNGNDTCFNENVVVTTCVVFTDLRISDAGTYTVQFEKLSEMANYSFDVSVSKKSNFIVTYAGSVIIPSLLILATSVLIWIFYYDILLVVYPYSVSSDLNAVIDLLIVYDDTYKANLDAALIIADKLSVYGVRSFIFDRDKQYGADIQDDYLAAISRSRRALFLFTESSIANPQVLFCFKNYNQKRLYGFNPTRKRILKELRLDDAEKAIYDNVKGSRDYYDWSYKNKPFAQRRFLKWIISKLR